MFITKMTSQQPPTATIREEIFPKITGVHYLKREGCWRARINIGKTAYEKYFTVFQYGSLQSAYNAAVKWRKEQEAVVKQRL